MAFENSLQHLFSELERIDVLIRSRLSLAKQVFNSNDQFQGLYVSDDEVASILETPLGMPRWTLGGRPSLQLMISMPFSNGATGGAIAVRSTYGARTAWSV